jgi:hypothetical protein
MTDVKATLTKIRNKEYYSKLLETLKLKGLLDIVSDSIVDGKVNYFSLIIKIVSFLQSNKKLFKNFTEDTMEKILILSIDEILKTNEIPIDENEIQLALDLLKSSFLFKSISGFIKDLLIKIYYKCRNNCCNKKSVLSTVAEHAPVNRA